LTARAGPGPSGRILEQSADELTRLWRLARATSRRDVFPGLLDGTMPAFVREAGRALVAGKPPEGVWPAVTGLLRLSPPLGGAEITAEWAVAMEVLAAVCESFGAEPSVAEWLARAVGEAERATTAIAGGDVARRPAGVLVARLHGPMPPPKRLLRTQGEAETGAPAGEDPDA
jgi:hypothetical protein